MQGHHHFHCLGYHWPSVVVRPFFALSSRAGETAAPFAPAADDANERRTAPGDVIEAYDGCRTTGLVVGGMYSDCTRALGVVLRALLDAVAVDAADVDTGRQLGRVPIGDLLRLGESSRGQFGDLLRLVEPSRVGVGLRDGEAGNERRTGVTRLGVVSHSTTDCTAFTNTAAAASVKCGTHSPFRPKAITRVMRLLLAARSVAAWVSSIVVVDGAPNSRAIRCIASGSTKPRCTSSFLSAFGGVARGG